MSEFQQQAQLQHTIERMAVALERIADALEARPEPEPSEIPEPKAGITLLDGTVIPG